MDKEQLKVVAVGDGSVGKTSLLVTYSTDSFPDEYIPTIFDNYTAKRKFKDKFVELNLWDTAGTVDHDQLRPMAYPQTDVFLLCFDLTCNISLENIKSKWLHEIDKYIKPRPPMILVGTKLDIRENEKSQDSKFISYNTGLEVAKKIKVYSYVECSSKTKSGVDKVFEQVVSAAFLQQNR